MVDSPPPPTQQQAIDAQQARHAAETSILSLFQSVNNGEGGSEDDSSALHTIAMLVVLTSLAEAIFRTSFRSHGVDMLRGNPDANEISQHLVNQAEQVFKSLEASELTDEQKAVLWSTWAYSAVADDIAEAVDSGAIDSLFGGHNLELKKVWISRSDAKVRKLHADLHGKAVPTSGDFWRWPLTGQRLRWPGDREAPPDATIGCRCVALLSWASQDAISETIHRITEHTKA